MRTRRWMVVAGLAGVGALGAAPSPALARFVRAISYDELFGRADLIVIARPTGPTVDTAERTVFETIGSGPDGHVTPVAAVGVQTPFQVVKVLKGRVGPSFVLHHLREARTLGENEIELDGPNLVVFGAVEGQGPALLMFLRREPDGRYAPYGGQTDPGDRAIQALGPPSR